MHAEIGFIGLFAILKSWYYGIENERAIQEESWKEDGIRDKLYSFQIPCEKINL